MITVLWDVSSERVILQGGTKNEEKKSDGNVSCIEYDI